VRAQRGKSVGAFMLQGLTPRRLELVGQGAGIRDPHGRRPFERRAVRVERRPGRRLIARARPCGVAAAVAEARPTADQDLVRAERVAVGASSVGG